MQPAFDTDVAHYSVEELLAIIGLPLDRFAITDTDALRQRVGVFVQRFQRRNPAIAAFFRDLEYILLRELDNQQGAPVAADADGEVDDRDGGGEGDGEGNGEGEEDGEGEGDGEEDVRKKTNAARALLTAEAQQWWEGQGSVGRSRSIVQPNQLFPNLGGTHAVLEPAEEPFSSSVDAFHIPVKRDVLNPNLKNTTSRFVNLDSQFRQAGSGQHVSSTDYTLDLSDTLKNTLQLSLYSYQIPFSWYVIDAAYGNTTFWIVDDATQLAVPVVVPPGNYNHTEFEEQLNTSIREAGFTAPPPPPSVPDAVEVPAVTFNRRTGKLTFRLFGYTYTTPNNDNNDNNDNTSFVVTDRTLLVFYDFTGALHDAGGGRRRSSQQYFNSSLGWLMGFRMPYVYVEASVVGNTPPALLDLNGTKYLILVIDDFNQNHVNNAIVSISQFTSTIDTPTYYAPDLPQVCLSPEERSNLTELVDDLGAGQGLLLAEKLVQPSGFTPVVLPTAPRTLTNAQLYTLNEIARKKRDMTQYLSKAPTSADILAILPVKTSVGVPTGTLLVEFSGSLQDSARTYFGPVDIDRMAVKLLDDKGNVLNLHGNDWCVTLLCECLYQY